jgi:hypothetical protein
MDLKTLGDRGKMWGFLVLRYFLVQFWFLQMMGKIRDQESGIIALRNLGIWAEHTSDWMIKTTPLPSFMVVPFTYSVPYLETIFAVLLLVGYRVRFTLVASCLLIVSLDIGLMFQLKHDVVGNNTIFLIASLIALQWEPYGRRWSLDARLNPAPTT